MDFMFHDDPLSCRFSDLYLDRFGLIFLGLLAFVLIAFLAAKHWTNKQGLSPKQYRMNTLKFWSFLWSLVMIYFAIEIYNVNIHPEIMRNIAECRHRSLDYVLTQQFYPGIALFALLVIPIILEYWSIKTGKKNPSMNNLSGAKVALVLIPFTIIVFLVSRYFYYKIMAQ